MKLILEYIESSVTIHSNNCSQGVAVSVSSENYVKDISKLRRRCTISTYTYCKLTYNKYQLYMYMVVLPVYL